MTTTPDADTGTQVAADPTDLPGVASWDECREQVEDWPLMPAETVRQIESLMDDPEADHPA